MQEVNVAFVGAGIQVDEDHGPAYTELAGEGVRLAAIADVDLPRARRMARKFGIPAVYGSLDEMLAAEGGLHAVVLAVPNALHGPLAMQALNAGLHVFVEKPMCTGYATAVAMAELARTKGLLLWPSQLYGYMTERPAAWVADGGLGPVERVRAVWLRRRGIPDRPAFISRELSGGGVGMDLVPHLLSVVLPALGMAEPVRAKARTWKQALEVEVRMLGEVDFANGVWLGLDASWAAPLKDEEEFAASFESGDRALEVPLSTGQPHTPGFDPTKEPEGAVLHTDVAGRATSMVISSPGWRRLLWQCIEEQTRDFVGAVRARLRGETESPEIRRAERSLKLGVDTVRIITALYESAESDGLQVVVPPAQRRG